MYSYKMTLRHTLGCSEQKEPTFVYCEENIQWYTHLNALMTRAVDRITATRAVMSHDCSKKCVSSTQLANNHQVTNGLVLMALLSL